MANSKDKRSSILTECLCKIQQPHTEEHAKVLPRQVMPTLKFPEVADSISDLETVRKKRVEELMTDYTTARAKDLELQREFERNAQKLLKSFYEKPERDPLELKDLHISEEEQQSQRLGHDLQHTRFQLGEVRNQLHTLKREMATYEKLVRQEIGPNVDLHEVLTSRLWKGRAQEIKRLKAEIAKLEAQAYGHKYLKNPLSIPQYCPRFPQVEDLIPKSQLQVLRNEARKRREAREGQEKAVSYLVEEYGNVSMMHKAAVTHNKMLAEEFRALKEQIKGYEAKSKDDADLIKNLIAHQAQMNEMLIREAHLASLVKRKQRLGWDADKDDELDAIKYKALWEASENEKFSLQEMVRMLTDRLEGVMREAEEAEKHCLDNENRKQEIEEFLEAQKVANRTVIKSKDTKSKSVHPAGKTLPVGVQLQAVREENIYLRKFLRRAIQSKVEDLKLYQHTMSSIREQYLETMERLTVPQE